jgi:fructoselysine-6-P-deglycase FrlB-like protein
MSIQAMAEEISNQTQDLPIFASQLRRKHLPKLKPSTLIFAGSGDSYATAVFAQEFSRGQAVASDPYELLTSIGKTRGKNLVIVSASGRTRTNIELAKRAKTVAIKRIAITANPESPLAKECDEILQLRHRTTGIMTSGTISFTTGLLACVSFLRNLPRTVQLEPVFGAASAWARELKLAENGSIVFVGSGVNFALALYGASKIHEVLGARAEAVYPEQLGHTKLFTIDKKRDLIVCISSRRDRAVEVNGLLRKDGFRTSLLTTPRNDIVIGSLINAIYLQVLALALAKRRHMVEVAFLSDPRRLRLSNKLIY